MNEAKALKDQKPKKDLLLAFRNWYWDLTRNTWFERHIEFQFSDFKVGVRNLVRWFKIVWRDRDYGYDGILTVMKFKIENVRDRILKNDIILDEDQQRISRYATLCVKLIDRYTEEAYEMEYLDYHKSELLWHAFSDNEHPVEMGLRRLEMVDTKDNLDAYFKKYPNDLRRTLSKIKKDYPDRDPSLPENRVFLAIIMGSIRQERANGLIWKILDRELRTWWD